MFGGGVATLRLFRARVLGFVGNRRENVDCRTERLLSTGCQLLGEAHVRLSLLFFLAFVFVTQAAEVFEMVAFGRSQGNAFGR